MAPFLPLPADYGTSVAAIQKLNGFWYAWKGPECALLALFRHGAMSELGLLSGVERKSKFGAATSVIDPTRTSPSRLRPPRLIWQTRGRIAPEADVGEYYARSENTGYSEGRPRMGRGMIYRFSTNIRCGSAR